MSYVVRVAESSEFRVHAIIALQERDQFLNRQPDLNELLAIEKEYEQRSFIGCMESLYCINIHCKSCTKSLKGQYKNSQHSKMVTLVFEAVLDSIFYCWNVFSGLPETNNEITVFKYSLFVWEILMNKRKAKFPDWHTLNGRSRDWFCYFSTDSIYLEWAILFYTCTDPTNSKEKLITSRQESVLKYVKNSLACYKVDSVFL